MLNPTGDARPRGAGEGRFCPAAGTVTAQGPNCSVLGVCAPEVASPGCRGFSVSPGVGLDGSWASGLQSSAYFYIFISEKVFYKSIYLVHKLIDFRFPDELLIYLLSE